MFLTGCGDVEKADPDKTRIVSLAPNITEIVCALGAQDMLVGRTTVCDFPPEIKDAVPPVGGFGNPSLETLVSLSPSIVLDTDLEDEAIGQKIDSMKIRRERIHCNSLSDIPSAIERIGKIIGKTEQAGKTANEFRTRVAELEKESLTKTDCPSVYIEISPDPLITVGRGSFISDLVRLAGGKNIGDEVERDYFQVSPEWIVVRDPDIIVCLYMSESGTAEKNIPRRPGWKNMSAVKNMRIYDGLDEDIITRPGPRLLLGIEELKKCISAGRNE